MECATVVWLAVVTVLLPESQANSEIMKDVTLGFGEALQHCREESQLTEEKMEEFFHYWRDDFAFDDRAIGCAFHCMSRYFNLLTDSHRMHHENTEKFIKSFPNGELLSKHMIEIIHTCEKQHDSEEDNCWRILRVAECFKKVCKERQIAPTMQQLMAEFIMESTKR